MPVKRRALGGILAGLGGGLQAFGELGLRRRLASDERDADAKTRQGQGITALRDKILANPEQADLILQLASADPLFAGMDLSGFKPDPEIAAGLLRQAENTRGLDVMFEGAKAHATTEGRGRAEHELAVQTLPHRTLEATQLAEAGALGTHSPLVGQARVSNEQLLTPVLADRAGQETGARARAGLAPDIIAGEAQKAGAVTAAQEGAKQTATGAGQPSPYAQERNVRNLDSIDTLIKKVSPWTAGAGSVTAMAPGTPARNFKAELDTLKANIAFAELAAMREASKTGGALGAISERELALLESSLGALDQGQSPANLVAQLLKIKENLHRWQQLQAGAAKPPREATLDPRNLGAVPEQGEQEFDYVPGKGLVPRGAR